MTGITGLYKISNGKVKNIADNEKSVSDKNYKYHMDEDDKEIAQMCKDAIDDYKERTGKDCEAIAGSPDKDRQDAKRDVEMSFYLIIKDPSSNIVKNAYTKMLNWLTPQLSNGEYVSIILVPSGTLK